MKLMYGLVFILFLPLSLYAENLGIVGHVYPIAEPDMLKMIHQKLQTLLVTGQLKKLEAQVNARVRAHVLRPNPVKGLETVTKTTVFYFTPQVTLRHNIFDAQGHLLFLAGTRINALDPKSIHQVFPQAVVPTFNERLLFINADSQQQVNFAKTTLAQWHHHYPGVLTKIILVQGNLAQASRQLGRIYFDQDGILCHHFGIHSVPATIVRVGTRLKVTEYAL